MIILRSGTRRPPVQIRPSRPRNDGISNTVWFLDSRRVTNYFDLKRLVVRSRDRAGCWVIWQAFLALVVSWSAPRS
jgi:hypothetical protein